MTPPPPDALPRLVAALRRLAEARDTRSVDPCASRADRREHAAVSDVFLELADHIEAGSYDLRGDLRRVLDSRHPLAHAVAAFSRGRLIADLMSVDLDTGAATVETRTTHPETGWVLGTAPHPTPADVVYVVTTAEGAEDLLPHPLPPLVRVVASWDDVPGGTGYVPPAPTAEGAPA